VKHLILTLLLILPLKAIEFDSVRVTPRQDDLANSHVPKSWTMETSDDGVAWTPLLSGTFENTTTEKIVSVPKTRARFLRINSLESNQGKMQTALGEVRVFLQGKEYSNADWKASANNEVPVTANLWGPASYAIDGNDQTCWHTTYETGTMKPFPHTLTVDFGVEFREVGTGVELGWDANPETVEGYVVVYGNSPTTMTQTHNAGAAVTTTVPNLAPGEWFFAVKALAGTAESELSTMAVATLLPFAAPPVTIPAPKKMRVVVIETSSNLTEWEPLAFVPLITDAPTRFIRTHISDITP
jgi:hypothetical protein